MFGSDADLQRALTSQRDMGFRAVSSDPSVAETGALFSGQFVPPEQRPAEEIRRNQAMAKLYSFFRQQGMNAQEALARASTMVSQVVDKNFEIGDAVMSPVAEQLRTDPARAVERRAQLANTLSNLTAPARAQDATFLSGLKNLYGNAVDYTSRNVIEPLFSPKGTLPATAPAGTYKDTTGPGLDDFFKAIGLPPGIGSGAPDVAPSPEDKVVASFPEGSTAPSTTKPTTKVGTSASVRMPSSGTRRYKGTANEKDISSVDKSGYVVYKKGSESAKEWKSEYRKHKKGDIFEWQGRKYRVS
jgi:hypothetical protein